MEASGCFPKCLQQQILTETVPGPLFVLKAATMTIAISSREDYISAFVLLLLCQMEKHWTNGNMKINIFYICFSHDLVHESKWLKVGGG